MLLLLWFCLLHLQVWDLAQGACVQTVARAHNNAITSIMMWGEVRQHGHQQAITYGLEAGMRLPSTAA